MDENQEKIENNTTEVKDNKVEQSEENRFWKLLGIGLLVFLGTYCAAYTILDWHMKSVFRPPFMSRHEFDMDKMMRDDMRYMNKVFDKSMRDEAKMFNDRASIIHMEKTPENYIVKIDLKSFDNNPDNIKLEAKGNVLNITGRCVKKSKHSEQISRIQQSFMFDKDVDIDKIQKQVKRNKLLIFIPAENEIND